jgi:hypothetical protein
LTVSVGVRAAFRLDGGLTTLPVISKSLFKSASTADKESDARKMAVNRNR